jgi:hypothetical protein
MTQIVADRRQVGSQLQKRYGSTVPQTVRVKPLIAEIRMRIEFWRETRV